nr:MAG TPA: hypothetical protein [Caudoviricetes sp.]
MLTCVALTCVALTCVALTCVALKIFHLFRSLVLIKENLRDGKKCKDNYIVELQIPSEAKRLSAAGRKCRCDKAIVVSIQNIDGSIADVKTICSQYDNKFFYTVGETVSVDNFCEDRWQECAAGIHFFINRQEAVNY